MSDEIRVRTDLEEAESKGEGQALEAVPGSEDFVSLFSDELLELVDASEVQDGVREQLKDAILAVLTEGLLPAYAHLLKIREAAVKDFAMPEQKKLYEDFTQALWHAYKDLMPRAALLMGFDIGFIFQKESAFKKGVVDFDRQHPTLLAPNLGGFFRRQRMGWQSNLARFRNHFVEQRPEDEVKFAAFYDPQNAEMLFSVAWGVMANVLPVFIEANFPPGLTMELLPEEKRRSAQGKRYRLVRSGRTAR